MNTIRSTSQPGVPRTLIADDQSDVLEALRLLLKSEGFHTESATSPAEVLQILRLQSFDAVLMDLNYARDTTSGQEGLDLLTQIQGLDETLPIIVMTAWGTVDLAVEAMRRGVGDFVQKPWDNGRLLSILRQQIENGRQVRRDQRREEQKDALTDAIREAADQHVLLNSVVEHIRQALQCRSVVAFLQSTRDNSFWITAKVGLPEDIPGGLQIEISTGLCARLTEVSALREENFLDSERRSLERAGCHLIVALRLKGAIIGLLGLGCKLSGQPFDGEDIRFLSAAAERTAAGIQNLRLRTQEREFVEAREIQQGLLPKVIPQVAGFEIVGAWQPASAVGGDYFDILKLSEQRMALCVADVVGKGIPAALLASNLQAAVKAFATESTSPRELCLKVNRVICSNMGRGKYITFFYALLDADRRALTYTNAGHNHPVLLHADGSHERLPLGGTVLGVFEECQFQQGEVTLKRGDKLVLFTDGVTEAHNTQGDEFGEDGLIRFLVTHRKMAPAELHRKLMSTVADFCNGEFEDDATLILISVL